MSTEEQVIRQAIEDIWWIVFFTTILGGILAGCIVGYILEILPPL